MTKHLLRVAIGCAVAAACAAMGGRSQAVQGIADWVYWERQLVAAYNDGGTGMESMAVKLDVFRGKVADAMHEMTLHGDSTKEFSVLVDALIAKYGESYGGAALRDAETVFPQCFPPIGQPRRECCRGRTRLHPPI